MPKISVIIPTYNRADLVVEAVESVLNQTFTDLELIVVDDGSKDNTEEVIRSISDPRLKYLKQSNSGVSVARNAGITAASGEFVAFLDSDDLFLPEKLACEMDVVAADPTVGLVYSLLYTTKKGGARKVQGRCYPPGSLSLPEGPTIHLSTTLIRRSWLEQIGGFDERLSWAEDLELIWRLCMSGCKMTCVSKPLSIRRKLDDGLTRDAHRYTTDIVTYIDTIFGDPRMPPELLHMRDSVCAQKFFFTAASAYLAAAPKVGRDLLENAVNMDPAWVDQNTDFLVSRFVNFIIGHSLDDPEDTLWLVARNLPEGQFFTSKFERRLWHKFYVEMAFEAYQSGQPHTCRKYALRALLNSPQSALRNRGLLSILVRSWIATSSVRQFGNDYVNDREL